MKKICVNFLTFLFLAFALTGCGSVGDKDASMSSVYVVTSILALLMLLCYCLFVKKREFWFILLFSSIVVVNIGYFSLSVSNSLSAALWANRVSYLGSVLLPLSMLLIICNVVKLKLKRWCISILCAVSAIVFLIAASPGYLDIYYKSVSLEQINGISVLCKEYGPWHNIYIFYLLGHFAAMVGIIINAIAKKKLDSPIHALILVAAVFANLGVWLIEQLVKFDFELLAVSYIISGFFLIGLYLMIQNHEKLLSLQHQSTDAITSSHVILSSDDFIKRCLFLKEHLYTLTATERNVYNLYLEGKSTKQIMIELNITENTLKYHNKNIYSKLGVSSRKQLIEYSKALETM